MQKRIIFGVAFCVLFAVGCAGTDVHIARRAHVQNEQQTGLPPRIAKGGPPAHAPAHGYRRKFQYRYYADQSVYHAIDRDVYFWIEGGDWRVGVELPPDIVLDASTAVTLELTSAEPYEHYASFKHAGYRKRHPGQGHASAKSRRW